MKKLFTSAALTVICLLLFKQSYSQNLVAQHGLLTTKGSSIIDKNGTPFSVSGNSLFWTNWAGEYCNADLVNWLKKDWHAGLVRIAMGVEPSGAYLTNPTAEKAKVFAVVDACIAAGLYVLIDWHDHTAHTHTAQAISFFKEMATKYGSYPNVMYELFNEPLAISWSNDIKPYALQVIQAIRAIDPDNMIIVGTPNWSQDVDAAANDRITGYTNIAYTLHFYIPMHGQWLRNKATYAMNQGLPLFVTEWGFWENPLHMGEFNAWKDFMKTNNLSNANWSVNTKDEVSSILKAGASAKGGWSESQLTEAGKIVKDMVYNWYGTPVVCDNNEIEDKVEAEKYCAMFGVQLEATTDDGGGQDVGYIDANDWLTYTDHVTSPGIYTFNIRVASMNGGGNFNLKSGNTVLVNIDVPATNGWQTWSTITKDVTLAVGDQDITIEATAGGFNINWFQFVPKVVTGIISNGNNQLHIGPNPFSNTIQLNDLTTNSSIVVWDALGKQIYTGASSNNTLQLGEEWAKGIYFLQITSADKNANYKLIKE
ncbi:MAG: cellulase family glycosylhydrolase [Bacteroidetes bacterium]|nr:cellulase family glycosylhydrolase [Bacteroidota bacterium]